MLPSFSGANLSDAAAFQATYADLKNVKTRGVVQIIFEAPVENANEILTVLGGMPRAAEERWFAIARLNIGGAALAGRAITPPDHNASMLESGAASGPVTKTSPARSLSQHVYQRICLQPKGRVFVEEFFQDILLGHKVNDAELAKAVIKRRLGIASLSEIDGDPVVSEQAEQLLNLYAGWERGYAE